MTPADRWFGSPVGVSTLWLGILAGPLAWAGDLTASYALVQWTCGSQHTSVLHLITLASLLIVATGAAAAWRGLQRVPAEANEAGGRPLDRGRFMAVLGLVSCALFGVAVIAAAIPRLILDACQS